MIFVIGYVGWRNSLIINSIMVAVVLIPVIWFSLANIKEKDDESKGNKKNSDFSRSVLFKDRNFYLIALNSIVLPFMVTGLFFYQTSLADFKNWTIEWLSFSFLGFAAGRTISSLLSGKLIDKYSALKLLPLYLIPFLIGLTTLLFFNHSYVAFVYLTLTGVSVGLGGTIKTAVIAETYGVKSLGGIRSVFATIMILGTALSPLLFGFLIDNGYSFMHIISGGIILVIIVSFLSIQINTQYKYATQTS
jgi:predicted MFS family arabinose efflux permease